MSGGDVEEIDDRYRALADVTEGTGILELDLIGRRRRQCAGGGGPLAIAELTSRALVNDLVVERLNLRDTDAPALRCGGFQHLPHGRAALAHRLDAVTQAARAVGVLIAIFLLVARRLRD